MDCTSPVDCLSDPDLPVQAETRDFFVFWTLVELQAGHSFSSEHPYKLLRNMHQVFMCPRVKHKSSALDLSIKPRSGFATVPINSQDGSSFTSIMPNAFYNIEQKQNLYFHYFEIGFFPFPHEKFHFSILKINSFARSC